MAPETLKECVQKLNADSDLAQGRVVVDLEKLSSEKAFYMRNLAQHLKSCGAEGDELLDQFLPEISNLCDSIQRYDYCKLLLHLTVAKPLWYQETINNIL